MIPARLLPETERTQSSMAAPMAVSSVLTACCQAPKGKGSVGVAATACTARSKRHTATSVLPSEMRASAAGRAAARLSVKCCQRVCPLIPSATVMLSEASASTSTVRGCSDRREATSVGRSMHASSARNAPRRKSTSTLRRPAEIRDRSGATPHSTAARSSVTTPRNHQEPTGSKSIARSRIRPKGFMRPLPPSSAAEGGRRAVAAVRGRVPVSPPPD